MIYGLLLPCRLVQVIDAATYVVSLPGQIEITVHLAGVEPVGITPPETVSQIETRISGAKSLACWLPQPKHDRGWFLGLRPGCSFAGDVYLASESLSEKLVSESIVVRLQGNREWRASEWVQTWQL